MGRSRGEPCATAQRLTKDRTREQLGRVLDASTRVGTAAAVTWVAAALAVCWLLTYASGGTHTAAPHLFYLPILFAASRFRWRGAVATAVMSGVAVGVFMPVDVTAATVQPPAQWLGRLAAFLTIGVVMAWLSDESSRSIVEFVRDTRDGRELRRALDDGELHAHFQPIVDLATGRVLGVEALCRWTDANDVVVPPSTFIPLAERTGHVVQLGHQMLTAACNQAAAWYADGAQDLMVAVNVSAHQLCNHELIAHVTSALSVSGLDPAHLCIEITESAIIHDPVTALAQVDRLHALGIRISLDDFGTGQSSLSYLQRFPIDIVKIDQSFVETVDLDPRCALLVSAIIQLAHTLGATTIAEGIERPTQETTLRGLGCDHGQGYHLGRPVAAAEVAVPLDVPMAPTGTSA